MDHVHQFPDDHSNCARKDFLKLLSTRVRSSQKQTMKQSFRYSSVAGLALASLLMAIVIVKASFGQVDEDSPSRQADRSFLQALTNADKPALDQLLDGEFTWIDANGKSLSRTQMLVALPKPANADVETQIRQYGSTAVAHASHDRLHVLRIWVKRERGWRILHYQEVLQVEKSEPPAPPRAGSTECQNPCKSVPFEPETQSEKEAIASWQRVMRAMANNDADAYAPLIADEFTATDTYHDRPYTKSDRLAQIRKQQLAGTRSAPPELISARMLDFGETVLMIAREQRPGAKAYLNTRMWVNRDGRWQMLFSFNTRIAE